MVLRLNEYHFGHVLDFSSVKILWKVLFAANDSIRVFSLDEWKKINPDRK